MFFCARNFTGFCYLYFPLNEKYKSEQEVFFILELWVSKNLKDDEKFDTQVQLMLLASKFDTRIEPHPISTEDFYLNNPFAAEIKRTGIEIKPDYPHTSTLIHQ